ncbi:MAG: hypothetical protein LT080_03660 [Thiobacillus sp.]|nr:hypothetical protein [Thiobacillus sp.]
MSLSFVSPKGSNQRKGDFDIPETLKIEPAGRATKNSPRFICISEVSGAQTPFPLIHPAGPVFGVAVRGRKVKTRAVMTGQVALLFGLHIFGALRLRPTRT